MIETIMLIVVIFVLSGVFWYSFFYQKEKKLTIILITHNLEETLFSDRIIVLENGKIIKDETKEEIYKNDYLERKGFELPFVVKLSQNLILYDLLDKVYFSENEVMNKLWP